MLDPASRMDGTCIISADREMRMTSWKLIWNAFHRLLAGAWTYVLGNLQLEQHKSHQHGNLEPCCGQYSADPFACSLGLGEHAKEA